MRGLILKVIVNVHSDGTVEVQFEWHRDDPCSGYELATPRCRGFFSYQFQYTPTVKTTTVNRLDARTPKSDKTAPILSQVCDRYNFPLTQ